MAVRRVSPRIATRCSTARDGFLINPIVVDARTEVTTQLLSDQGYAAVVISEAAEGDKTSEQRFTQKSFEKKFRTKLGRMVFDTANRVFSDSAHLTDFVFRKGRIN